MQHIGTVRLWILENSNQSLSSDTENVHMILFQFSNLFQNSKVKILCLKRSWILTAGKEFQRNFLYLTGRIQWINQLP